MLTPPVQAQILFELRNALHDEDDDIVLDDIRELLRTLRDRTDVTYPIATEIETILGKDVSRPEPKEQAPEPQKQAEPPDSEAGTMVLPNATPKKPEVRRDVSIVRLRTNNGKK